MTTPGSLFEKAEEFFESSLSRHAAAACLLLLLVAQCLHVSTTTSNTFDEPAHITTGYAHVAEGRDYLAPLHHPVLGRALLALPLLSADLVFDSSLPSEELNNPAFHEGAVDFIYENTVPVTTVLFYSRLAVTAVAVLMGVYVFVWSRELWGDRGAFLSLFLYVLSPNIIAHSSIATTDLFITAFFFITAYHLQRTATYGFTWSNTITGALALAAAMATKHSAVLLLPLIVYAVYRAIKGGASTKQALGHLAAAAAIVFIFIWAVYGLSYQFTGPGFPGLPWEKFGQSPLAPVFDAIKSIKLLPESYLYSLAGTLMSAGAGKPAFLMGEYSLTGWWYYFIVAFLIKTPVATIFFIIAATAFLIRDREAASKALFPAASALFFFVVVSMQNVNIGLRHVLPVYPFIFTALGYVTHIRVDSQRAGRLVFAFFCAWYVASAVSIHPHQLSFFNGFIGGPDRGYRYLVDSNLDWGQDLPALKEYMDEEGIEKIQLAYFGLAKPEHYGIDYELLPSYHIFSDETASRTVNVDGYVAISATMVQGVYTANRALYGAFLELPVTGRAGHSIFVYFIEPRQTEPVRAGGGEP